ncbi:MAG: biotin carboxylase N-terminal domain-containing protein [Gaiella sp.]
MQLGRVLVANRGEIALRVMRTCDRLGIETVAVAPADDAGALHVRRAVHRAEVGSYLDVGAIVAAARSSRADAVHPGYGFLAESADLAQAVVDAGLVWIGPPPEALRLGGDKLVAKRIAAEAGVPTLPAGAASTTGFPLVVKATAGGGGRGMRVVRTPDELPDALDAAGREAAAAFGRGEVYCERYLERPRHVEAQLVGHDGGVEVIGLRDCSVQRRHQKLLEESPPFALDPRAAHAIERAARAFAEAIGYRNLGTAEFLVDGSEAWFLELNARIQVEHPVTEEVTGLDLVEVQLRLAAGEALPPSPPAPGGHAVEVRLCAEDPRTFLPRTGRIERLSLPAGVRVDSGVEVGDDVGARYDPLLAKLIAHGPDRAAALERLARALGETEVVGVETNLPFLRWLVAQPALRAGPVTTAFLVEHPPLHPFARRRLHGPWGEAWRLNLPPPPPAPPPDPDTAVREGVAHGESAVTAPMPGTVLAVDVAPGDRVETRQRLVLLEAMKLEHPLLAPFAGVVVAVDVTVGDTVAAGSRLVELET